MAMSVQTGGPAAGAVSHAEREALRESVRDYLAGAATSERVRAVMADGPGHDQQAWAGLAGKLGLAGLCVPERFGGAGAGHAEALVVAEEIGRALACVPYLASAVLATSAVLGAGDERACLDYLPGMAAGDTIATLVDSGTVAADPGGGGPAGWQLTGTADRVLDGAAAEVIVVAARCADGVRLFVVDARAGEPAGLVRVPLATLDQTRRLAELHFGSVAARPLADAATSAIALARARDLALIALAAEQTGGARRCLQMAVDYAKTRTQFGRPIGSFQAIKHACADLAVEVEAARAAVEYAGRAADLSPDELPITAAVTAAHCTETFQRAAGLNVQVHGAIGFTWEHDAQLYLKRARSDATLLGAASAHRERLLSLLESG